ncbi:MAG TPA: hypothetical protein VE029_11810 [Rhizobacter sp.]|nr:hypothetical protein [Rhizobacter sp.]
MSTCTPDPFCAAPSQGRKRAGKLPASPSRVCALEDMGEVDLGGMKLGCSPTDHTGLDCVDISVISAAGRYQR